MLEVLPTIAGETDEYLASHPAVRRFCELAKSVAALEIEPAEKIAALRPAFGELLADQSWLPKAYGEACTSGGMGGGIGQWLLFRSADHSLVLFSLVVPPTISTPVHDHLAWGLVGLYRGVQLERVYAHRGGDESRGEAHLDLVETRRVDVGDTYDLIPPDGDIHSVETISDTASVSIHLLGGDAGCIWRHAFDPDAHSVRAFRSGYTNATCPEDQRHPEHSHTH
ncbi:MAG: hypothetical protein HY329_18205 [Chloroflexi bacterium]|nr:hypothetical protein [Chloroflexota bacterium]